MPIRIGVRFAKVGPPVALPSARAAAEAEARARAEADAISKAEHEAALRAEAEQRARAAEQVVIDVAGDVERVLLTAADQRVKADDVQRVDSVEIRSREQRERPDGVHVEACSPTATLARIKS